MIAVFCGYRTNCDHARFEVPHTAIDLFMALQIPFGVSVIVAYNTAQNKAIHTEPPIERLANGERVSGGPVIADVWQYI